MKLLSLKAEGFGALQNLSQVLNGASCAILGLNEAGKTSFIDALTSALYGLPKKSRSEGKEFDIRYGLADCRAQASLKKPDGANLTTSTKQARGQDLCSDAMFKSLLLIRGGACSLSETAEGDFIPAFVNRIAGAGSVDLGRAASSLSKITAARRAGFWDKLVSPIHERVSDLERAMQTAASQTDAARTVAETEARLKDLRSQEKTCQEELAGLESSKKGIELALLRDKQALINQCADELAHRDELTEAAHKKLLELEQKTRELTSSRQVAQAKLEEKQREVREAKAESERATKALGELPAEGLRGSLKEAMDDLGRQETEAARGAPKRVWQAAVAAALGLAAGVIAYQGWDPAAGGVAAVVVGVGTWFVFGALAQGPSHSLDQARMKLGVALSALGTDWKGLAPANARTKLEEADSAAQKASWTLDRAGEKEDTVASAISGMEEEREAILADLTDSNRDLAEGLKPWAADTVAMAGRKLQDLEQNRGRLNDLLGDVSKRLGRPLGDAKEADAALRQAITRLEGDLASNPAPTEQLAPDEHQARLSAGKRRLEHIRTELVSTQDAHTQAVSGASELRGSLEGAPAELFAELQRKKLYLEDLAVWREAAEIAEEVIGELTADTGQTLKSCVQEASPLFQEMTGGRYKGVTLVKDNPFDAHALEVEHKTLRTKPVEWLSKGAQDILWLALRMAWAKRAFPETAFLILDEPCLNLDPGRASAAVKALLTSPIMAGWQIIILTKDDRVADACAQAKADRITLGSD